MKTEAATRALLYARISRFDKDLPKTQYQLEDCRALCASYGYEVVGEFCDDGISAWKDVARPDLDRLEAAIEKNAADVVVAVEISRLHRDTYETLGLWKKSQQHGLFWHTTREGQFRDENDLLNVIMRGWQAENASALQSKRLKETGAHRRANGTPRRAGPRPFGYLKVPVTPGDLKGPIRLEPHPVEAPLLKDAYQRVLNAPAGSTGISAITRDWNNQGVRTVRGKHWNVTTVKGALTRPTNAGLVQLREEVLPDVVGQWERLIDPETFQVVAAKIDAMKDGTRDRDPRHLMGGLATCGRCGQRLMSAWNKGVLTYCCPQFSTKRIPELGNRGHVSIRAAILEAEVSRAMAHALMTAPKSHLVGDGKVAALQALYAALAQCQAKLENLIEAVEAGALKPADVAKKRRALDEEEADLNARINAMAAESGQVSFLADLARSVIVPGRVSMTKASTALDEIQKRFEALPLEDRRALVAGLLSVDVLPGRGAGRIDIRPAHEDLADEVDRAGEINARDWEEHEEDQTA